MLELVEVSKSYGSRRAVDGVSFAVPPGSLTGFVGANGAGKTTTMRVVLGIVAADGGTVTWRGAPMDAVARRRTGYMPEERGLYPRMTVRRQLVYLARLHGASPAAGRARADELLERLDLGARADDQVDALSLGNQQRAQIAAALVHDPDLLLLDEPFSGLDPVAVDRLTELLRDVAAGGVPVLFSSHQLELVERLCDRVVVLAAGRVVAAGEVEALRQERSRGRLRLVVDGDAGWVRDVPAVRSADVDGPTAVVETDEPQALLQEALRRGAVHEFSPLRPTLAELYREVRA
ncbi:MAG: type transport system ATP-binding protein [Frankiales bacterium]|nr:type transport system ATP-binding protein [Frankiales bacterium]